MGFPRGSDGKESACNTGDPDLNHGSGRYPAEGKDYPHHSETNCHVWGNVQQWALQIQRNLFTKWKQTHRNRRQTYGHPRSRGERNQEVGINIYSPNACMLSHFSHVRLFATPWTIGHQAPLSMEFSKQEHWSGLPYFLLQTAQNKIMLL